MRGAELLVRFVAIAAATLVVAVVTHEMGHVIGAWVARMNVTGVRLGTGWKVARFQLRATTFTLNLGLPDSAVSTEARSARHLRRRIATMTLAGPVLGTAAALALLPLFGPRALPVVAVIVAFNLINLVPIPLPRTPSAVGTDGTVVVRLAQNDAEVRLRFTLPHQVRLIGESLAAGRPADPVIEAYRQDAPPDDPTAKVLLMMRTWAPGETEEQEAAADEAMEVARACTPGSPVHVLLGGTFNPLIYEQLEAGRRPKAVMVGELAAAVAAPVETDRTAIEDTLAWALASLGRPVDGLRHSNHVLTGTTLDAETRARCLAVNAICLAGIGRIDKALERRAEALELDPSCPLIPHVDRALDAPASQRAPDPDYAQLEKLSEPQPEDADIDRWLSLYDGAVALDDPEFVTRHWLLHRVLPGIGIILAILLLMVVAAVLV